MAEKFGKTWWGDAWLQSLTHIDYANRIPREELDTHVTVRLRK